MNVATFWLVWGAGGLVGRLGTPRVVYTILIVQGFAQVHSVLDYVKQVDMALPACGAAVLQRLYRMDVKRWQLLQHFVSHC